MDMVVVGFMVRDKVGIQVGDMMRGEVGGHNVEMLGL